MAMTTEDAQQFHNRGRDIITKLADAADDFRAYARVFEVRGGAAGMPELGIETEGIVVLHNDLVAFLALNNRQQTLDLYRHDY